PSPTYTPSLHDALPIYPEMGGQARLLLAEAHLAGKRHKNAIDELRRLEGSPDWNDHAQVLMGDLLMASGDYVTALSYLDQAQQLDRKSTRLNSSHDQIS